MVSPVSETLQADPCSGRAYEGKGVRLSGRCWLTYECSCPGPLPPPLPGRGAMLTARRAVREVPTPCFAACTHTSIVDAGDSHGALPVQ